MSRYIYQLIAQGENQQLDFKYMISDAKKIARTFSAFANTKGGRMLIGVKDNGVIAGIKTEEEAYMLESAAEVFCKPKVKYSLNHWKVEGKQVLEVVILESKTKPHLAPWKDNLRRAFVRVGDENFVANSIQVEVWKKKTSDKGILVQYKNAEKELLSYLKVHDNISLKYVCRYCKIPYPVAKKILVNLVSIGVIKINFSESSTDYSLK